MSGNDAKTVLKDTLVGAGTGALTGGAMGAVGYGIQSFLSRGTSAVSTAGNSAKNTVSGIADKADDAVTKLDDLGTAGCFIAGTSILTVTGTKNIEDIHVVDKVYAQNVNTDEQAGKEVRQIFWHEVDTLVYLEIEGEEIVTTPNHPFYVKDKGWVEAGHLTEEDKLVNRDHQLLEIKNLRVEEQEEPVTVYNFEVEDYHTYYVGDRHVLVHNSCQAHAPKGAGGTKKVPDTKNPNSQLQKVFDVADDYKLSDDVYNNHIVERHGSGGTSFPNKSKFNSDYNVKNGINDALASDKSVVKPNTGGRGDIFLSIHMTSL